MAALRLYTVDEFDRELIKRGCRKNQRNRHNRLLALGGRERRAFSLPPAEETGAGDYRYPDWLLGDLIKNVGLPKDGPRIH